MKSSSFFLVLFLWRWENIESGVEVRSVWWLEDSGVAGGGCGNEDVGDAEISGDAEVSGDAECSDDVGTGLDVCASSSWFFKLGKLPEGIPAYFI